MPARDLFHDAVKAGLQKEGWVITDDPFFIAFGGVDLYVDLGAERVIAASKGTEQIAVEVKCFLSSSPVTDFHQALGQFLSYRLALANKEPARSLYLAVPQETYEEFFSLRFAQLAVQQYQLRLIVYDPNKQEIRQWTGWSTTAT